MRRRKMRKWKSKRKKRRKKKIMIICLAPPLTLPYPLAKLPTLIELVIVNKTIVMIPQIFIRTGGPITVTAHKAGCNSKIESRSDVCLLRL
jgi:hypothetical protein